MTLKRIELQKESNQKSEHFSLNKKSNIQHNKKPMSKAKPKPNQSFMSTTPHTLPSPKKQFPSISLSKHLEQYKAYRSIQTKKKHPDSEQSYMISPEERSLLMNRMIDMPSIHAANEMSEIGDGVNCLTEGRLEKWQQKILKSLSGVRKQEEWRLYITKSELVEDKTNEFEEIEQFLLKFISKCLDKTVLSTPMTQFSNHENQFNKLGQQTVDKKMNKTSGSFLDIGNRNGGSSVSHKKELQSSLKVLKEQLNTLGQQKDSSFNEVNQNRTAVNFRPDNGHMNKSILMEKMQARYKQQINKLTFQRSLLQKKLQLYQSRISLLQSRLKEQNVSIDPQQSSPFPEPPSTKPQKPTPAEQILMNNLINQNKYKSEAEVKKIQNQTLMKELALIKEYSFKLKLQNQKLKTKLDQLQQECNQCRQYKKFRELWLMQCEETIGWKSLWREKKDQTTKLHNKIKILKEKNKQLLHSFNFSMVVNPDQEQDKQELQNIIKGFQDWLKVMSVPRVNCPLVDPKALMEDHHGNLQEQEYMPDPENLNFKLLKPNFFIFFEAYEKTIMMEKNILNTRPLEPTFFVKIRAILDSIYNHFNSYGNFKYWTSFPEFVIGFLEKYEVSFTTLKIETRKKSMPSEQKLTFLMNLFNKKLSNTWECDMFRSFILEEYTLDEIYFFLDCRNDLNGGMTLTHGFGTADPVPYVKLHQALATAQRKLSPYESYIIERVKTILKSRKKQKNGDFFIDRHFVLKLLLEVYALEKTKSERVFEASFKSKPNSKRQSITYSDFFAFMSKNFDFLTTIDICELYRETYALSSGKISFKAIHYVCQSKGLFIPLIWAKRLNMNVLEKSLSSDMVLLDLQNNARKMSGCLADMGVEEVSRLENDLNYFLRQVDWYRNNRQVFYFKMQEIKTRIIRANCMLDWQGSTFTPNELLSTDEIREGIMQIHSLIHQSDNPLKLLIRKRQDKEKAIKQITRNFKIRIQESMKEFRRIDDEQLKKLKTHMTQEMKSRKMREQQEREQEEKENQLNGNKENNMEIEIFESDKPKQAIIGNTFANVSDMLRVQMSETKARNAKFNLGMNPGKESPRETSSLDQSIASSKEHIFQGRKPSKLLTIQQSNENKS